MLRRRPKVERLARKGDAQRLVAALRYRDEVVDSHGRLFDLGTRVRSNAARALVSIPDGEAVDIGSALVGALGDPSGEVRAAAAAALGARHEVRAAAALGEAVLEWDAPRYAAARVAAAEALIALGDPESIVPFVDRLIARPAGVGMPRAIVTAMVERGGEESWDLACRLASEALGSDDPATVERAAEVLVWLGPGSVNPLLAALTTCSHRLPIIVALGRLGDLRAVGPLAQLLSDDAADIRAGAAMALGELAEPRVADALLRATTDTDRRVRAVALEALGNLGALASIAARSR